MRMFVLSTRLACNGMSAQSLGHRKPRTSRWTAVPVISTTSTGFRCSWSSRARGFDHLGALGMNGSSRHSRQRRDLVIRARFTGDFADKADCPKFGKHRSGHEAFAAWAADPATYL